MDLEQTLTSRDQINGQLRGVLDEATGKWGVRVNRVELKSIDPPETSRARWSSRCAPSVTGAPDPHGRGHQAVADPHGRGREAGRDPGAEGNAQAAILNAEGEARAILQVFDAVTGGRGPEAAGLPVPADAAEDRGVPVEQDVVPALGADERTGHVRQGLRRSDRDDDGGRPAGTSPLGDDLPPTTLRDPARRSPRRDASRRRPRRTRRARARSAARRSTRPPSSGQKPGRGAVPPRDRAEPPAPRPSLRAGPSRRPRVRPVRTGSGVRLTQLCRPMETAATVKGRAAPLPPDERRAAILLAVQPSFSNAARASPRGSSPRPPAWPRAPCSGCSPTR